MSNDSKEILKIAEKMENTVLHTDYKKLEDELIKKIEKKMEKESSVLLPKVGWPPHHVKKYSKKKRGF